MVRSFFKMLIKEVSGGIAGVVAERQTPDQLVMQSLRFLGASSSVERIEEGMVGSRILLA